MCLLLLLLHASHRCLRLESPLSKSTHWRNKWRLATLWAISSQYPIPRPQPKPCVLREQAAACSAHSAHSAAPSVQSSSADGSRRVLAWRVRRRCCRATRWTCWTTRPPRKSRAPTRTREWTTARRLCARALSHRQSRARNRISRLRSRLERVCCRASHYAPRSQTFSPLLLNGRSPSSGFALVKPVSSRSSLWRVSLFIFPSEPYCVAFFELQYLNFLYEYVPRFYSSTIQCLQVFPSFSSSASIFWALCDIPSQLYLYMYKYCIFLLHTIITLRVLAPFKFQGGCIGSCLIQYTSTDVHTPYSYNQ